MSIGLQSVEKLLSPSSCSPFIQTPIIQPHQLSTGSAVRLLLFTLSHDQNQHPTKAVSPWLKPPRHRPPAPRPRPLAPGPPPPTPIPSPCPLRPVSQQLETLHRSLGTDKLLLSYTMTDVGVRDLTPIGPVTGRNKPKNTPTDGSRCQPRDT